MRLSDLRMLKQFRVRYSLKALLATIGITALLLGWYVSRLHSQDAAIAVIEDNGGMVGYFNELLVIGVDEKSEIPAKYVTRKASPINRDVLTIRIANYLISDEILDVIDSLPTVKFIEITGGCSQTELQNLQQRFPGIEIEDMESVIAKLFR